MEYWDQEMEQRVWNRVNGTPGREELPEQQDMDDLRGMMLRSEEAAADYRQLAALCQGGHREQLRSMSREEESDALRLRGMLILSGAEPERREVYSPGRENRAGGLARACRRCGEMRQRYLEQEGPYRCVFEAMAESQQRRMGQLLEMIGQRQNFGKSEKTM